MESGSNEGTVPPMVLLDMASALTMSMDAALQAFAKEINIIDSACKHLHDDSDDDVDI